MEEAGAGQGQFGAVARWISGCFLAQVSRDHFPPTLAFQGGEKTANGSEGVPHRRGERQPSPLLTSPPRLLLPSPPSGPSFFSAPHLFACAVIVSTGEAPGWLVLPRTGRREAKDRARVRRSCEGCAFFPSRPLAPGPLAAWWPHSTDLGASWGGGDPPRARELGEMKKIWVKKRLQVTNLTPGRGRGGSLRSRPRIPGAFRRRS